MSNHLLAFIGRRDYVEQLRADRKSGEWQLYRQFIRDERLSILAQQGLTLRSWEQDAVRKKDIEKLRGRIRSKYGEDGLHIAQVVQSQVLNGVVPSVISSGASKERAARLIESFLASATRLTLFVQEKDSPALVARTVNDQLSRFGPAIFVVFARGRAIPNCNLGVHNVITLRSDYKHEVYDIQGSRIVVLIRSDAGSGFVT